MTSNADPELACVVMSLANAPWLTEAVRSVLAQDVPVEVVVANCGGGDPESTLRAAGIQVPVLSRPERLNPGALRNMGVAATRAPYVSFLAADCLAEPGWARARLAHHRAGAMAVSSAITNAHPHNIVAASYHAANFARRLPGTPAQNWQYYSCSYARRLFDDFGPFREGLRVGEDTEFHKRLFGRVPFAAAHDVRTAHRNPTTVRGFLKDQYERFAFRVRVSERIRGTSSVWILIRNAVMFLPHRTKLAYRFSPPRERRQILLGLPLILLGTLARVGGALFPGARQKEEAASAPGKIFALLPFRNAMRWLPGYFANVSPQVDGILALDDGSTDGSAEFVAKQPSVLELIRRPRAADGAWDEPANQRALLDAAGRHGADWVLALDADERVEKHFRIRAMNEIARAGRENLTAFSLLCRELWGSPDAYRVDGHWGKKRIARFFQWRKDAVHNQAAFHGSWAPDDGRRNKRFPPADLIFYHLAMIRPEDREARRRKWEALDPEHKWQEIGYAHLTDETDLQREPLPRGREYEPLGEGK